MFNYLIHEVSMVNFYAHDGGGVKAGVGWWGPGDWVRSDSYNRHPNITHGRSRAYSGLGWRITVADGLAPLLRNRENAQQKV